MTDFIADLEAELVAAARRRARHRMPRPRLVPAVAAIAIVVAAVAVLRGVDGPRTADDRPLPPPRSGILVTLPLADAISDGAGCRRGLDSPIPGKPPLGVFDRPQTFQDRDLPWGHGALPADFVDEDSLRRAGDTGVYLIRVGGISGYCDNARRPLDPGVCVITGGESSASRCFGDAEIAAGRAIATAEPVVALGTVFGIAPDGVDSVKVSWRGGTATAPVVDNGYVAQLPGIKPGEQVRVELVPPVRCEPSQAAYGAVPALIDGEHRDPPRALEDAMARLGSRGAWRAHARVVRRRDRVDVWVVPDLPCDRPTGGDERVCVWVAGGSLVCDTPALLRRRGASIVFREGDLVTVAGIAPVGKRLADVRIIDVIEPIPVRVGVFGAMRVNRLHEPVHITYR